MRSKLSKFLIPVLIISLYACNKGGKSGLLVPKDAIFVAHVNTKSLSSKLTWEEIRQSGWFSKMAAEKTDSFSKKLLNDPEASGVDLKGSGFTFFAKKQNAGGYFQFQGTLKDAAAFESFLKQSHENIQVQKSDDLSYAKLEDDVVVTWTKDKFIVIGDAPISDFSKMYTGNYGGSEPAKFMADSLLIFAKTTYKLEGDALLDNNDKFTDLMKTDGDVHFFFSTENFYNTMAGGIINIFKFSDLMKDNVATGTLSFDDGKISLNGHSYVGETMRKIMDKYPMKEINKTLLSRLPAGDALMAGAFNYPVEMVLETLKASGLDGFVNGALGKMNLTTADISKAFSGEFAFAMPDITFKPVTTTYDDANGKPYTSTYTKTEPNYIVGIGIKEQPSFDKVFGVMRQTMGMGTDTIPGVTIKNQNKWLVVSNTDAAANSFLAGNNKPAYADRIDGHVFGMYVNINRVISNMSSKENSDSIAKEVTALSLNMWEDGIATGDYSKGEGTFKMEVNLRDKKTNSLKQINSYSDKMQALTERRYRGTTEVTLQEIAPDTSINEVPPPPPPVKPRNK